jgi:predicted CxxxxCH...CXXCH cytochrome family protein
VKQGVAVDPYIVGAIFQEVAADGVTVLQRESSPSDANGVFTFPQPLTYGSTVEMKASNKGLHGGAPFQGMLRRQIETNDAISVAVTPLTTMLAQGVPAEDVLLILNNAGFSGLTSADLYGNPMSGLQNRSGNVSDQELELLQAAMAVEGYMEVTGNFEPTVTDLSDFTQAGILNSMADAVKTRLNVTEFTRVRTALNGDPQVGDQVILDDLILAVVKQQQTMVAQLRDAMSATGDFDPAQVEQRVQDDLTQIAAMVKEQCMNRLPQNTPADGATLYADNCAGCHGALADSNKQNRSAAQTQTAIDNNIGGMGYLSGLSADEIQAIADALVADTTPPPPAPADGPTLYADNCAGCHGALAATDKPGRTPADIQAAIDNNIGGMGYLSSMTSTEVQAIANVLPAPPPPNPGTPPDGVALYNSECAGCHGTLASTDKPGRTAAQIQTAIDNNVGGMGYLNSLTTTEVQAIAGALPAAPPPPVTPDGPALYTSSCAGCHGTLAATEKPGRTAAQIQTAIDNNAGGMGYLNTLTAAEVQAIAAALPAAPPGPDYGDCTACHGQPPAGNSYPNVAGAHAIHTSLASVKNNCATCHAGAGHNGTVNQGIAAVYNAKSGSATANSNNTCSSVSCHGGQTTPNWQTGSIAVDNQCTSCHASGTGQYNSFSSGRHSKHISAGYSCTVCHNTTKLATGHFSNLATSSFEQDPAATIGGGSTSVGSYTPSTSNATSGTCSSISCHGSKSW